MEHYPFNFRKTLGYLDKFTRFRQNVSTSPRLVARRTKNLGDLLIQSEFTRNQDSTWLSNYPWTLGMFPCNRCQICPFVQRTSTFKDAYDKETYEIHDLINRSTSRLIYMITCPCPKIYIGKTKRQLKVRIGERLREINDKTKIPEKPLAKHFAQYHSGSSRGMKVKGIYALKLPPRRGDFDRILQQKEKWWVYRLKSLRPVGLNTELNLQPFLPT